jgi:hypothetical protein
MAQTMSGMGIEQKGSEAVSAAVPSATENQFTIRRAEIRADLLKWLVGSIALTLITTIGNWTFQAFSLQAEKEKTSRELKIKEKDMQLQYLDKFTQTAIDEDITKRIRLAHYISRTIDEQEFKQLAKRWKDYYAELSEACSARLRAALGAGQAEVQAALSKEPACTIGGTETLRRAPPRRPSGKPPTAQDEVNVKMQEIASSFVGYSTADVPGTDRGLLAGAWCVNEIARIALGKPISGDGTGDNGLSVIGVFDVLRSRHIQRSIDHVDSGMVIVSPTIGNVPGHIGVVGKRLADEPGNFIIYSLSSARASFQQNFTLKSWQSAHEQRKGLATYFFEINYKEL